MSYRVKNTRNEGSYDKLEVEPFRPRSELGEIPDTKKVQSELVLLSKEEGLFRSYTKYRISLYQEKGGVDVSFRLWQGYDYNEAQMALGNLKRTLTALLDSGTVLLTRPLLKEIVVPAPMAPEEIPSCLVDVMDRHPDAHPEWFNLIQTLANSPDPPPTDKASRKEYLAHLKSKLKLAQDSTIDQALGHSLPTQFVALLDVSDKAEDEEDSKRIWTQFRRGTLTAQDSQAVDKTRTWLMDAVEKQHLKSSLYLVFGRINTNDKHPSTGDTALHIAVCHGNLTLVRLLLAYQADPTIPNANGETPIDAAEKLPDPGQREDIKAALKAIQDRREKARSFYQQNCKLPEKKNSADVFLLSLDGGGMRAVIMCHILAAIESRMKELCSSAKSLRSYFDYFAGTSSGAIVQALLLFENLQIKFAGIHLYKFMNDVFCCSKSDRSDQLKQYITNKVGEDTVMSDLQDGKFIVTSTIANISPNKLHLMTSYGEARDGQKGPKERKVWEALTASAAAPTYFPAFGDFLDGGLMANNPTLPVMAEIFEQAKKDGKNVKIGCVLSLGTGYLHPPEMVENYEVFVPGFTVDIFKKLAKCSIGLLNLLDHFVEQTTQSDGECVHQAKSWCQSIGAEYFRFSPPLNEDVAPDMNNAEELVSLLFEAELYILEKYEKIDRAAKIILSK